jgi:predicted ArsR family transcriptional regulator
VAAFAAAQVAELEERCEAAMRDAGDDPVARAAALASALTAEGYAASTSTIASGGQLCQHHCPVAHVAAEFPQLCEAETQVISRLVGTHVQRLATIAHGDGVCTTHIPGLPIVRKIDND